MPNQEQIVADMISLLAVAEPTLSSEVGTPIRKLLDVVAEEIAESGLDGYLGGYQYDIDSCSGSDLDEMVRLFGFSRLPPRTAKGVLTFTRTSSDSTVLVPIGAQASTVDGTLYQIVVSGYLDVGQASVDINAAAVNPGSDGNVGAGMISTLRSALAGVTGITNISAFFGGTDAESDDALRTRFKATIFRNMAGTESMYLAVALDDPDVVAANIVGLTETWSELIQFTGGNLGPITTSVPDAVSVVDGSALFGASLVLGNIFPPAGVYTLDTSSMPPKISRGSTALVTDNAVYQLQFDYTPTSSRNSPTSGVTNRVDVWTSGVRAVTAAETLVFSTSNVFSATTSAQLYTGNFDRPDESHPVAGDFFVPYGFTPPLNALSTGNSLVIGGTTYTIGVNAWLVVDRTATGGSNRSVAGLELASHANLSGITDPATGIVFSLSHDYNAIPVSISADLTNWRLIGTDVMVHQGREMQLAVSLVVVPLSGASNDQVQEALFTAISDFLGPVGFGSQIQPSDVLEAAHGATGVDEVRFATSADDSGSYAMQRVNPQHSPVVMQTFSDGGSPARAVEVYVPQDSYPVLTEVNVIWRVPNNFGAS